MVKPRIGMVQMVIAFHLPLPDELRPHVGEVLLSRSLRATYVIIADNERKVKHFF